MEHVEAACWMSYRVQGSPTEVVSEGRAGFLQEEPARGRDVTRAGKGRGWLVSGTWTSHPLSAPCIWLNVALNLGFQQKLLGGRLPWPVSPWLRICLHRLGPGALKSYRARTVQTWMVPFFFGFRMTRQSCMVAFEGRYIFRA